MCFIIKLLITNFNSAVKQLIVINRIQNKSFFYIIYVCVLCIFIMCIYKYTHTVYILKIFRCIYIYICIFLYFILYINIFNI